MKNLKKVLCLLSASGLTTLTAGLVIACDSNPTENIGLVSPKIWKHLALLDHQGNGLKEVFLTWEKNTPAFAIDSSDIALNNLLVGNATTKNAKAKDQESFVFLTDILQIKLASGTNFEDGEFDSKFITTIKPQISDYQITTNKIIEDNDQEKLIITKGTYNLQFFNPNDNKGLGTKYQLKVKPNTNALFNIFSASDPIKLSYQEFVYPESPIKTFRANALNKPAAQWEQNKIAVPLISKKRTNSAIKFNNFEQLIGWKATFNVKKVQMRGVDPVRFSEGDAIIFTITLKKDNFNINLQETLTIKIPTT